MSILALDRGVSVRRRDLNPCLVPGEIELSDEDVRDYIGLT
jgi:hypothetical protein